MLEPKVIPTRSVSSSDGGQYSHGRHTLAERMKSIRLAKIVSWPYYRLLGLFDKKTSDCGWTKAPGDRLVV